MSTHKDRPGRVAGATVTRSGWQDFKSPSPYPTVRQPAALEAVGASQRAHESASRDLHMHGGVGPCGWWRR